MAVTDAAVEVGTVNISFFLWFRPFNNYPTTYLHLSISVKISAWISIKEDMRYIKSVPTMDDHDVKISFIILA